MSKVVQQESIKLSNFEILKQREKERAQRKVLAKLEHHDYFPFTHGDLIENNRKMLGRLNFMELQRVIVEREKDKLQTQKPNKLCSKPNLHKIPGLFPQMVKETFSSP
jgi:hypothetical protein